MKKSLLCDHPLEPLFQSSHILYFVRQFQIFSKNNLKEKEIQILKKALIKAK